MMYRRMLMAVGLSITLVLAACGEPQPAPPPAVEQPPAAEQPAPEQPAPADRPIDSELPRASAVRASTFIGLNVEDAAGEHIGTVDDALVIVTNGKIQYAVISASGLEGMFTDWILPLPIEALTINPERNAMIVSSQAAHLVSAPGFERDAWPDVADDDWDFDIRSFWADLTGTDEPDPTPTPMVEEEAVDEDAEADDDAEATPTPVAEEEDMDDEEAVDEDAEADDDAEATPTPVAEEEAVDDDEAETAEDAEATATPVAEEEDMDEEEAVDDDAEATPTPVAEEEDMDDEEAVDEDAEATATPVAEEEAVDDDEAVEEEAVEEEAVDDEAVEEEPMDDEILVRLPHALSLNKLLDFELHDPTGENLGTVEDMVIDMTDGRIKYVVLTFGGFLGMGQRYFAFPWRELVFDPVENAFVTTITEEALSDAPGFDRGMWPDFDDPAWDNQFQEFWETDSQD